MSYSVPEGHEEMRQAAIQLAFEKMSEVLNNDKATNQEKIDAARTIDSMSDTIVKTQVLTDDRQVAERTTNKLAKQLEKLTDVED